MRKLQFTLFKAGPPSSSTVPSLQELCMRTLLNSESDQKQVFTLLSDCPGSLKQDIIEKYKQKHPEFKHIYDEAEKLLEKIDSHRAIYDISDPQHVLIPLCQYQKEYRGNHWREIEFWALQRGLNLAVGLSVELGWAGDKPFAMTPYVQVFDRLLRQKYKTAGFVNGLFMAMLNSKSTTLILPYATAMSKSLQVHEKELPEVLRLLQLIPNCMLGTIENLKEWLDSVIKHSLEDFNTEFEAHCERENAEGQNWDQYWVKIFDKEILPLTQRLLNESEQSSGSRLEL